MKRIYRDGKHINFKYAKGKTDIYGKTFHAYYELYLLLNGKVEFINSHTRQFIHPYQLIIIPPGEYHQFIVSEDIENYERCVLNINSDFFEAGILKNALVGKEILTLSQSNRIIKNYLYLIQCISSVSEMDSKYILSAIGTDIVFLIKRHSSSHELSQGTLHPISLELMRYIDEYYKNALDLNTLSEKFHFSVSSICHIFKEDFGISIKKYILQKRINAAYIALQNGERPEAVCTDYGFSNYSTFYRAYKNYYGISPSACTVCKQRK